MGNPAGEGVETRQTRSATRGDERRERDGVIASRANGNGHVKDGMAVRKSLDGDDSKWRARMSRSLSCDRTEFAQMSVEADEKKSAGGDHILVVLLTFGTLAAISWYTMPATLSAKVPTVQHVWYYGWLSALSTGLGSIPLLFWSNPSSKWLGVSNAIAAGMMFSASFSLVDEGRKLEPDGTILYGYAVSHIERVLAGIVSGMGFVYVSKNYLEEYEDLTIGDLKGIEAAKMLLIVGVMTLHSFAEGLGIGVSFCGANGSHLGVFISASLAVHNVPEGLAVALVLIPRGVSKFRTFVWSIFTSLPQPLIAAPVFLFVENFVSWEPVGLGFAAGAMFWVACFELLGDAIQEISMASAAMWMCTAFIAMMSISGLIDSGLTAAA